MAKRSNGEGNISPRRQDGKVVRWQVSFPTGLRKDNGKPEIIYRYAPTQKEATEILRQLQTEKSMGISQSKGMVKTGEWVTKWIEEHKAPKLASSTMTSYRNNARLHIIPAIGEIPLRELESYHIQRMLERAGGSCSKFIKIYNIIHGALEKAVDLGMIAKNPCKGVAFPKDDKKDMRVFSLEEQKAFIQALEGEYYRPLFLAYLYTGMRLGEGLPLLWSDIDLEMQTIRINKKAIIRHDFSTHTAKAEVQNTCKTKSSKRTIAITPGLVKILTEHKAKLMEKAAALGVEWSEDSLAFPNTRGNMPYCRNVQSSFEKIVARAGLEKATMHCLRHTYATRCFENDMELKIISKQLGHASVKTTADIYVHCLKDKTIKEIDKLARLDDMIA